MREILKFLGVFAAVLAVLVCAAVVTAGFVGVAVSAETPTILRPLPLPEDGKPRIIHPSPKQGE